MAELNEIHINCSGPPIMQPIRPGFTPNPKGQLGYVDRRKIWEERQELTVYFLNEEVVKRWKCGQSMLSLETIMAWACTWNTAAFGKIPKLKMLQVQDKERRADIRVWFSENQSEACWSMVGMDANTEVDPQKPTMVLSSLQQYPQALQRSLVIHEFGHALGLEHEHQRSNFWDVVEKFFDTDKLKRDVYQCEPESKKAIAGFERDWLRKNTEVDNPLATQYDPESIMHYTFKTKWLKNDFQNLEAIDHNHKLNDKEKEYLRKINQKRARLPKDPSLMDFLVLQKAYGGTLSLDPEIAKDSKPLIVKDPQKVITKAGGSAEFTVVAYGNGLTYQWFGPGQTPLSDKPRKIFGATSTVLQISNVDEKDVGLYGVKVQSANCSISSYPAKLSIDSRRFYRRMSTEELIAWLAYKGLGTVDCGKIEEAEITGESFLLLDENTIEELHLKLGGVILLKRLVAEARACAADHESPVSIEEVIPTHEAEASAIESSEVIPANRVCSGTTESPKKSRGAAVQIENDKIWEKKQTLKVYFMNLEEIEKFGWKCRGKPIGATLILFWAGIWNTAKALIPAFQTTTDPGKADIRVKFSEKGGNWSLVGSDAAAVKLIKKPTMQLNLKECSPELQQMIVVHQFGHALGLEHEHHHSDLCEILDKHLDDEKMDTVYIESGMTFEKEWPWSSTVQEKTEYDPKSIMHCWFDINWISKELRTHSNIESDVNLSAKEKRYLQGLLEQCKRGSPITKPSDADENILVEKYRLQVDALCAVNCTKHVVRCDLLWKGKPTLTVHFLKTSLCFLNWWGLTTDRILEWAGAWGNIKTFEEVKEAKQADIRVEFSDKEVSWSMIGTDANKVKSPKPTLVLNLNCPEEKDRRSLVIHEFGHVLGLGHEHQRKDFWKAIKKHIDMKKMKHDPWVTDNFFKAKTKKVTRFLASTMKPPPFDSQYDPESIMHFRFDTTWLADAKYRDIQHVKDLPTEEQKYINGIHIRSGGVAAEPSEGDLDKLTRAYQDFGGDSMKR